MQTKVVSKFILKIVLIIILVSCNTISAQPQKATLHSEMGFLGPVFHKVQFSKDGTYFDYIKNGGQNNLFFFTRLSFNVRFTEKHSISFLYQPLSLETRAILREPIRVDGLDFPAFTSVRFFYNFPFYRVSYLRHLSEDNRNDIAIGFSLQIRNATIEFESLDGELFRSNRDIGPVPLLKFRSKNYLNDWMFWGSEIDGIYAPVSYLNGSDEEITGALLDASIRMGYHPTEITTVYLNVRYLGGGAVGTSEDELEFGDGYVKNWWSFVTFSAGFSLDLY